VIPLGIMCTRFTGAEIERALTTRWVGRPVHYWPAVGSTMDEARRLVQQGSPSSVPEGTMVIADEQTSGRGRLERTWWAPAGSSLLLSLVFRPRLSPHQMQRLTMICSLAACDAIASVSGLRAAVKWPNDVLIGGRKVCGILTELELRGQRVDYAIVGMGINVNVEFGAAPAMVSLATSLSMEAGHPVSRLDLLVALLTDIEGRYEALQAGHSFEEEWADRMVTLRHYVRVTEGREEWQGLAVGVDRDGALLLRLPDGTTRRVLAGDVTLSRPEDRA
jgi:BirA family biotin operon repressor/biotin-[acetyl-CoA-carboxylase] ligase